MDFHLIAWVLFKNLVFTDCDNSVLKVLLLGSENDKQSSQFTHFLKILLNS